MGLKKGTTNNLKGRPKGVKNKVNKELRQMIVDFLSKNLESVQKIFNQLNPRDKVKFILELLPYGLPKYNPVEKKPEEDQLQGKTFFQMINEQMIAKSKGTNSAE